MSDNHDKRATIYLEQRRWGYFICWYEQLVSEGFGVLVGYCFYIEGVYGSFLVILNGYHSEETQKNDKNYI